MGKCGSIPWGRGNRVTIDVGGSCAAPAKHLACILIYPRLLQTCCCDVAPAYLEMFSCRRIATFCSRGLPVSMRWSQPLDPLNNFPNILLGIQSRTPVKQGMATGNQDAIIKRSPLEHKEYLFMQSRLRKDKVPGIFGQVCLYILDHDIKVILSIAYRFTLNATSHWV